MATNNDTSPVTKSTSTTKNNNNNDVISSNSNNLISSIDINNTEQQQLLQSNITTTNTNKSANKVETANDNDLNAHTASTMTNNTNLISTIDPNDDELPMFVKDLLEQMQSKFNVMGDTIISRIDDMGTRVDDLEKSINDLMNEAGVDIPSSSNNDVTTTATIADDNKANIPNE